MVQAISRVIFMLLLLVSVFTLAQSSQTSSAILNVSEEFRQASTEGYLYYFEDPTRSLRAEQVLNLSEEHWQVSTDQSINLGTSTSQFWFRLGVYNEQQVSDELVLLNNYAPTDQLSFYHFDQNSVLISTYTSGDAFDQRKKIIKHFSYPFPFSLEAEQTATLLLSIQTEGNVVVPVSLWERNAFFEYQSNYFLIFGLLLGVLLITGVYNAFIFLKTRETLFLSFAVFISCVAFLLINQSGIAAQYLWPSMPQFNQFAAILTVTLAMLGNMFFALKYLPFKGWMKRLVLSLMAFGISLLALFPVLAYSTIIQLGLLNGVILLSINLLFACYLMSKGDKSARVYAIAWTPFIFGTVISASIRFDLISYSVYTEFAGLFCAVITIVWLSIAIADRLNRERVKRITAQKEAISNLKRYEDLFAHSIEGIFTSSVNGTLIRANAAFVKMFGYATMEQMLEALENHMSAAYKEASDREKLIAKLSKAKEIIDEELEFVRANGKSFWASCTLRLSKDVDSGETVVEGSMIDVTARKVSEMKLAYLAAHDPLTSLFNRREFENRLDISLNESKTAQSIVSVLYMDLDQFKVVNDTCGHTVGDKLLKNITRLMTDTLNGKGLLARLGGDEFGLILQNMSALEAFEVADEILQAIGDYKFNHEKRVFNLGISIGLVELSSGFNSVEDVMSFADTACYAAKDAGRNRIHVYSSDNIEFGKRRFDMELVTAINSALANNSFRLYHQKIAYNDSDYSLYGYEILLRMENKEGLSYPPSEFIPAAERYGLMLKIDKWVVSHTFQWLARHPDILDNIVTCSINLSGQSIGDASLCKLVNHCFQEYQIKPNKICFEITETHAIENVENTIEFIQSFQKLGCTFSLDDFGSGLSSYGYLKTLPINHVKIDGRFVQGIVADPADYAMVESIHAVARAMGKKTIAEYVENADIAEKLRAIGIDYLQGYEIAIPCPVEDDEQHLQNSQARNLN